MPAAPGDYAYCRAVEKKMKADLAAGRKILLSNGTMFLIRSGYKGVPLDRGNSILELRCGQQDHLSAMSSRIKEHHYDRLYMIAENWYGKKIQKDISDHYIEIDRINKPKNHYINMNMGHQGLLVDCNILKPRSK